MAGEAEKVWRIVIRGQGIRIIDLPAGAIDEIAETTGIPWYFLVDRPLMQKTTQPARLLIARAAHQLGLDPPPEHMTADQVQAHFELVDDDVPPRDESDGGGLDPTGSAA